MPRGRYNNMNDEDWHEFGNELLWWASGEYRMLLKASGAANEAVAKLALNGALESLAKFLVVMREEKGVIVSFDDAYKEAFDLVKTDFNLDFEAKLKL